MREDLRRPRIARELLIDAKDPIGGNGWVGLLQIHSENRAGDPNVAPRARARRQMREGVGENRTPRLSTLPRRSGTIVQFTDERVADGAWRVAPHKEEGGEPPLRAHEISGCEIQHGVLQETGKENPQLSFVAHVFHLPSFSEHSRILQNMRMLFLMTMHV